jgi:phosphatidylserine decarboxylase
MESLFIAFQHIVPQHALSRCAGWLAELCHPIWLKNWIICRFVAHFDVDMTEAANPDLAAYASFNDFFTRELRPGARPVADADIVSPADGAISQLGRVDSGRVFQAKGRQFSVVELLGGDAERAAPFIDGQFATIYLSPRDYHRVHMPMAGRLTATRYIPGDLFSVNAVTAANVECLFARNERLVCHFETGAGPMVMVLVGAMVVAGIETVWAGRVAPPDRRSAIALDYMVPPAAVTLEKSQEMGRFMLGSTVILLFPSAAMAWDETCVAGSGIRLGQKLGTLAPVS